MRTKATIWIIWAIATLMIGGFYAYQVFVDADKQELLIGAASHGHFQIEMECSACHTQAFSDRNVLQEACLGCHRDELEVARDSHPKSKFTDPRNADLLANMDARLCVTCHTEHQAEQTLAMGLTMPVDYCVNCHQEIAEERPSHEGLAFDSCASSGCHNYHDNRALYTDFLVANAGGDWLQVAASITAPNAASRVAVPAHARESGNIADIEVDPEMFEHWAASSHAEAGVGCAGCHQDSSGIAGAQTTDWLARPGVTQCSGCHSGEAEGFLQGKHGVRLAQELPQLTLADSSLAFADPGQPAHQGCTGCHGAHDFNTRVAATEACLGCHADEHSLAFTDSPHGQLGLRAALGEIAADQSVSCATCHMPRLEDDATAGLVRVQHNQNDTLRPNEKMIRPVCMQCHNLSFSIDALADAELIRNNFNGQPKVHVPSIDWALESR